MSIGKSRFFVKIFRRHVMAQSMRHVARLLLEDLEGKEDLTDRKIWKGRKI